MTSIEKKFANIQIGDKSSFSFCLAENLVNEFGKISGDLNPIHMDESYAKNTQFGQRVVHGMVGGMLISRLIGMNLPGKFSLYLKQTLNFKKPMFIGMNVEVEGVVIKKTDATKTVEIFTTIKNEGTVLIDGQALVMIIQ